MEAITVTAVTRQLKVSTRMLRYYEQLGLIRSIRKMCALYARPDIWQRMIQSAMTHPVGWDASARDYAALYDRLSGR